MRRREAIGWFTLTMILIFSLTLPGTAAELQGAQMGGARLEVGPTRLDWLPRADYERWVLTVAGPGDLYIRREFKGGKAPFLSLFDSKGDRLPDGSYNWELRGLPKPGALLREELLKSGHFFVREGSFVAVPVDTAARPPKAPHPNITAKNFVETGTLVVQNNTCIGNQCATNDANFSALKLKSTQPNVLFDDVDIPCEAPPCVSTAHDWALVINPSDVAQFSIRDVDGGLNPFSVAAGAPDNSLYVRGNGNVGLGTSTPDARLHLFDSTDVFTVFSIENSSAGGNAVATLHAVSNSATAFLSAHGSGRTISRFGQTLASWSELLHVSGNGLIIGTLTDKPLILGTNNANRVQVTAVGDVGIGTTAPSSKLHVNGGDIRVSGGSFIDDGVTLNAPDYVFEPNYKLMPLERLREFVAQEKHLPNVPNAREVKEQGLNLSQFQMRLLEKIEELTLYTLSQHEQIASLHKENIELKKRLEALEVAPQKP